MKIKNEVSAGGIVFRKLTTDNRKLTTDWLICQHSQHKGWVFPKGLIGDSIENETKENTAIREVEEEGGIKAKVINHLPIKTEYMYRFKGYLVKKTVYYFLMEYLSGDPKNHDFEMMDAKFVSKEEVIKILSYKSDKEAFNKMLDLV